MGLGNHGGWLRNRGSGNTHVSNSAKNSITAINNRRSSLGIRRPLVKSLIMSVPLVTQRSYSAKLLATLNFVHVPRDSWIATPLELAPVSSRHEAGVG
jgi:hypothetical protein